MPILTLSLPNGRTLAQPIQSIAHAVRTIRAFALSRGVSSLAVDWSVGLPASAEG